MKAARRRRATIMWAGAVFLWSAAIFAGEGAVSAQRGPRCKIALTQARIPRSLSERRLIRFVRSHRARRLTETQDENLNDRKWLANALFQFSPQPPGDIEFHVLFYDRGPLNTGRRVRGNGDFISEMSVFMRNRNEKTVLHRLRLPRRTFNPNRDIRLVVTVRRRELGHLDFSIVGQERERTGRVDFTDGG